MTIHWDALAAICSLFGVLATVVGIAFTSGRLTEKLGEASKRIDDHTDILKVHGETLNEHEVALGRLNEWKDGYNAAARVAGQSSVQ